jgi:hypothetical protein
MLRTLATSVPFLVIDQAWTHLAALIYRWPTGEDLMTTHSRRNEPLPGVFQTCAISSRIESIE